MSLSSAPMEPAPSGLRHQFMRSLVVALFVALGVVACTAPAGAATYPIAGHAVAGPTCPVEPASPVPGQCAARPVAGAILVITDSGGHEVARITTTADGSWSAALPAGTYTLTAQPVAGLMGTARPMAITVAAGPAPSPIQIEYDTGIR